MTQKIRVLEVSGSYYDMGYAHGRAYHDEIHHYATERVHLVCEGKWSGRQELSRDEVLALARECLPAHREFCPDLMEEIDGMAAATNLSPEELLIVSGFTDFVDTVYNTYRQKRETARLPIDDCTAFIVPDSTAAGAGFFGQTWDMHDTATEFVILLHAKPENDHEAMVFTTTGCVGQIGMNSAGVCVGINNLLGADGQIGVMWPFVVRKMLQTNTADEALQCLLSAPLAGAHNYLIFDKSGTGYNVEAMSTGHHIIPLNDVPISHTNHCVISDMEALAQVRPADSQASSEARLGIADDYLAKRPLEIDDLIALTRADVVCTHSKAPYHIESCGAAIMRPQTNEFWAVWGLPSENEYERFTVGS